MGRPRMKVGGHPCINNIAPTTRNRKLDPKTGMAGKE